MKQAHGDDDLAAEITSTAGDDSSERVVFLDLIGVFDVDEFFVEPELHAGIEGLPVHASRKLFACHAIRKSRHVDDAFIRVQELRLPPSLRLDLRDERREPTVGCGQAGGESRRAGADDDDVPGSQLVKLRVGTQFLDGEVGHVESPENRAIRVLSASASYKAATSASGLGVARDQAVPTALKVPRRRSSWPDSVTCSFT